MTHSADYDADPRNPRPCPTCGQTCTYDGWGHVHASGSCVIPPEAGAS